MPELPRLETERLVLRVPTPGDAEEMAAFVSRNREHFAPWEPARGDDYFTVGTWRATLQRMVDGVRSGTLLQLVLCPKAPGGPGIVGQCRLSEIVRGPFQAAYLGFGLDRDAVGQGLMTEALRAAIEHAFSELGLHRIMANYMPANVRSAAVLERLGFVREGFARDYLFLAGAWRDHVLTALTNERWSSRGPR